MTNDTANYLGQQRWHARQVLSAVNTATIKNCPTPQGTPLISGGVADAGGSTTTVVDAALIGTSIAMVGKWIKLTSGTNNGLVRRITAFVSGTGTVTWVGAVNGATGAGDTYDIWMETTVFNRLVITGYSISANNSNAAQATWTLRHLAGAQEVILGGSVGLTSGNCNKDNSNAWLEMIENQGLQLSVAGAITGQVDVMVEGRILPMTTTSTDFYDSAAH